MKIWFNDKCDKIPLDHKYDIFLPLNHNFLKKLTHSKLLTQKNIIPKIKLINPTFLFLTSTPLGHGRRGPPSPPHSRLDCPPSLLLRRLHSQRAVLRFHPRSRRVAGWRSPSRPSRQASFTPVQYCWISSFGRRTHPYWIS